MSKKLASTIVLTAAIFFALFSLQSAHAAILYDTRAAGVSNIVTPTYPGIGFVYFSTSTAPSTIATTTIYVTMALSNTSSTGASCILGQNQNTDGLAIYQMDNTDSGGTGVNWGFNTSSTITSYTTITYLQATTTMSILSGKYYAMDVRNNGTNGQCALYGTGGTFDGNGTYSGQAYLCMATDPNSCAPTPPPPTPTISIQYPFNSTSTPDFRNWLLQFNVETSTSQLYQLRVNYGTSSGNYIYHDTFPGQFQGFQSTAGFLNVLTTMQKGVTLTNGTTYYAQAELDTVPAAQCPAWTPCATQITTTTEISFTIDNTKSITPFTFTSNPSSIYYATTSAALAANFPGAAEAQVQVTNPVIPQNFFGSTGIQATTTLASSTAIAAAGCVPAGGFTDIGGGIAYGFCSIINFIFLPSQSSQAAFNSVISNIQSTPPFVWFFGIQSSIITSIGNASTTGIAITMPVENDLTGTTTTLVLIPASAANIPFLGQTGFINQFWNLLLEFIILCLITMLFVVIKYFIKLL